MVVLLLSVVFVGFGCCWWWCFSVSIGFVLLLLSFGGACVVVGVVLGGVAVVAMPVVFVFVIFVVVFFGDKDGHVHPFTCL